MTSAYRLTQNESSRLNILRAVMIVLVVYLHIFGIETIRLQGGAVSSTAPIWLERLQFLISQIIARSAVPTFFLVSGLLLFRKEVDARENIRKKTNSLLLPYLLLNALWVVVFSIAQSIPRLRGAFASIIVANFSLTDWIGAFIPLGIGGIPNCPFLYPLWFIFNLYILNLLARPIQRLANKYPLAVLTITAFLWLCDVDLGGLRSEALFFFLLGFFAVRYDQHFEQIDTLPWLGIAILYGASLFAEMTLQNQFPLIHKCSIILGIVFFARLSGTILRHKRLSRLFLRLSTYSFAVYLWHEFLLTFLKKATILLVPQTPMIQLVEYLALPLLCVFLCVAAAKALRRLSPGAYAVFSGGRG